MVTTPRLGLELGNDAGLREEGRSLWPEKSEEPLPPTKGATKLVEREALGEKLRLKFTFREVLGGATNVCRWSAKLEAAVATSIACRVRERE